MQCGNCRTTGPIFYPPGPLRIRRLSGVGEDVISIDPGPMREARAM